MSKPTTEELKDLLNRASDGPWRVSYERGTTQIRTASNESIMCDETYYPWVPENYADWDIIALAPTLAAEVVRLRTAMVEIAERHIPDQPAAYGLDEADWARRQHTELRRIARQALSQK